MIDVRLRAVRDKIEMCVYRGIELKEQKFFNHVSSVTSYLKHFYKEEEISSIIWRN